MPENWDNKNLFLARISAPPRMNQNPGENLAETLQRLHAIVESSPVAIIALDGDGMVRMWNTSAERIFGWSESEVVGRQNPTIPPDLEQEYRELDGVADARPQPVGFRNHTRPQRRYVD